MVGTPALLTPCCTARIIGPPTFGSADVLATAVAVPATESKLPPATERSASQRFMANPPGKWFGRGDGRTSKRRIASVLSTMFCRHKQIVWGGKERPVDDSIEPIRPPRNAIE